MPFYVTTYVHVVLFPGCSLNAREIRSRHEVIYSRLCEGFEEKMGSVTNQTALLEYLNLDENDKSLLTRAVKAVFPGADLRRIRKRDYPEMYLLFSKVLLCTTLYSWVSLQHHAVNLAGGQPQMYLCLCCTGVRK